MTPDKGKTLFDGEDLTEATGKAGETMHARIGGLFQSGALFEQLNVRENVAFRLIHCEGLLRRDAKERATETLKKPPLMADVTGLHAADICGGIQKRVSLAPSIISNPDLIFFDEPNTRLDPIKADAIRDLVVERVRGLGAAAVSITHEMANAPKIANEIARQFEGRIIWRGL